MSDMQQQKQGIFLTAMFDRAFDKERKRDDRTYTKTHYLGLLARTDNGTLLYEVRTKYPERYANLKRDQVITLPVALNVFQGKVYYSDGLE